VTHGQTYIDRLMIECEEHLKQTDVSEELTASIIIVITTLMMEAVCFSEKLVIITRVHGAISQKTATFEP
jgi:hypothetical protein